MYDMYDMYDSQALKNQWLTFIDKFVALFGILFQIIFLLDTLDLFIFFIFLLDSVADSSGGRWISRFGFTDSWRSGAMSMRKVSVGSSQLLI